MRYEDTSGSLSNSAPEARDDADTLPNGSNGPASGNVITGAGTTTGKAGADVPASAHVIEVRGAGGTDAADGGQMQVDGRYGALVMDDDGSYKYVADGRAPANFRDLFQYTLANSKGERSVADLVISRGGEYKVSENAQQIIPGPDGVVTLPPGVDLSDVHVVGRNLVIDMPDGTQVVIVDGAVFVPQLVLGGVEVPATNLAALLIDSEAIRTTAGPPQSSGGNFDVPVPPLDPGVPLGDLIPPTELVFTPPEFEEIGQFIDREPEIQIQPVNQTPSVAAEDSVNEKGLPTRNGGEPAGSGEIADGNGSNNSDSSETTTGTILIDSPDGVGSVTINGIVVTGVVGQTISGAFGTLTITGFNGQNILYSYTLNDNTSGDNTHDDFSVTVTDDDGDQATATLIIDIIDDVPTARPDTDAVAAGTYGPETGNVLTGAGTTSGTAGADTVGADNAHISLVTGFNGSNDASGPFVVNGQYGVLTMQADGSYSYVRNPGTPGGVQDVFNYTLTDGDGDTSTTTLTISIGDAIPQTGENPLIRFDDDALPGGNPGGVGDDSPDTVNATGQLAGSGGDGPITFAVQTTGAPAGFSYVSGGAGIVLIQQNGHTVLTVTVNANGSYTVVQNAAIDHSAGDNENNQVFTINYTVTDQDNDSAPGTFTINVDDDTPVVSIADRGEPTLTVDESDLGTNASASFASNFSVSFGADGPAAANSLVYTLGINAGATGLVDVATGQPIVLVLNGGVVEGHVGDASGALAFTVSVNASGTVTLDQIRALQHPNPANPDDAVTLANDNLITLTATATDHDGDTAGQTLNIGRNLSFDDDGPTISLSGSEASLTVDETNLAINATASFAGAFTSSFGADGAGTVTYALSVLAPGANSGLVDVATGQAIVLVNNAGVIEGHVGNAAGALAFTVSVDASGNVTLDQIRAVAHPNPANPDDSVTLSADNLVSLTATVTDKDGDSATATLNIGQNLNFKDDGPSITLSGTEPSLTVDETNLAANAGPTSFASAFTPVFGADGPAAANSLTYALGITGGNGTNSGLVDTLTHEAVLLVNNGGVIEGRTATTNQLVFTVTVNGSGQVTLDQIRAVVHPNTANPDDSVTLSDDNLITLTATATDRDGDQASATLNIGRNLNFEDDGPSANNDTDVTNPATDTAVGNVITGVGTTEGAANADAPGADGFGGITNLVGFNGSSDSNPAGGFDVTGQFGTLHMDANGNYTYTRTGGAGGSTDTFTYTYVDGDGDPATATLKITIADETPVAGTVNVGLDDDALAGGNPGGIGDDPNSVNATGNLPGSGGNAPLTFGVLLTGAPAGFTYESGGAGVVLVKQGGVTVLTVTVNSTTGEYSVVQNAPITHQSGGDENNQAFTINYTVTDSDTDVANGTINISVDDDTPVISLSGTNPSLTVDETVLATNDSASFAGMFTTSFGADGPAAANSITYALGITGGNGTASGLTDVATGQAIVLVNNGGVIEGHVGTAAGALAFTVSVNSSGVVTLDQIRAVTHPNASNPDDSVTLSADNLVTLTATVTDKDGDSASATANIGQNLNFEDDGPSITANGTQPSLTVDETNLAINATASFAGIFTPTFGADGPAAANSLTYALGITGGNGVNSGLVDVATGQNIVLVLNGGVVEGHVGSAAGALAFTVSVDGSGNVTLDQIRAVVHPNTANPDDSVTLAADNLITLTATATDRDGDQASATANIGQNLNFKDDGPSISATGVEPQLTVDETVLATNASASFAGNFNSSFGADGAGTIAYALSITGGNGTASGLTDVATGQAIVLVNNAGVIEGHVGNAAGALAFTVSVDGSGNVTLDQIRAVVHPNTANPDDSVTLSADNLIVLTGTVTDRDGDTATASINIGQNLNFKDDGPSITANGTQPSLTVDETVLATNATASFAGIFTPTFGADGAAAANSLTYTLGITGGNGTNSGLVDTATGQNIVLVNNAGVIEGHVGSAAGALAFTVSVDGSGNVTLDQVRAVRHPDTTNPDDSVTLAADNLITLTATATDRDGDTASATANIGQNLNFEDDGPSLGVVQSQQTDNNPATAPAVGTLHFTPGADGAGSTMTITANVTGLKSGGFNLVTVQSGNVLTAYQDTNGDGIHQAGEATAVFTLTVNPTAGTSGQYVFDLITPLDPTVTDTPIGGSSSFGAGPTGFQVLEDVGGQDLSVLTGYNTTASFDEATWLATGNLTSAMITAAGINGSTAGWGVDNNIFSGTNEFMFFDFGAQPLSDPDGAGGNDPNSSGATLPNISTATFDFIQYTAADDIKYVVHYTDGTFDSGAIPAANLDPAGPNWTFVADAGKFIADIQLYTSGTAPGKVDLVSVGVQTSTLDKTIPFTVQLTDGDGDPTATANFSVHVQTGLVPFAPAAPVVLDLNGDGVQFLGADAGVTYDYGHGSVATAWASPQDGILVNDANHDGNVSPSEFVFGGDGVSDLQALAAKYGPTLDANDADFANFAVWQDANSDGKVDGGELQSLGALGISSISLSSDGIRYSAADGDVTVIGTGSYTRTDGSTGSLADAEFATGAARPASNSNAILMGALAAAGLAAESAAVATTHASLAATTALTSVAPMHSQTLAPVALDAVSGFQGADLLGATQSFGLGEAAAFHAPTEQIAPRGLTGLGGEAHQQAESVVFAQGTHAPSHDGGALAAIMGSVVAMPSAQQLAGLADGGVAGVQHNQVVSQVLADALHGGNVGSIESVLSALPTQSGGHSMLEALASHGGAGVSIGDSSVLAGFAAAHAGISIESMMVHFDAAPTHA